MVSGAYEIISILPSPIHKRHTIYLHSSAQPSTRKTTETHSIVPVCPVLSRFRCNISSEVPKSEIIARGLKEGQSTERTDTMTVGNVHEVSLLAMEKNIRAFQIKVQDPIRVLPSYQGNIHLETEMDSLGNVIHSRRH
jgi:hypothetical protein